MGSEEAFVTLVCEKCQKVYELSKNSYYRRRHNGTPNYCQSCMKEYANNKRKGYFSSLSEEEKKKFKEKRNWYANLSEEEKKQHSQRTKDQLANRTPEEWAAINKKNSEGLKKHWKVVSEKDKLARVQGMRNGNKKYWESMTPEERRIRARQWFDNLSPEEQEKKIAELSQRMTEYNNSLDRETQLARVAAMKQWHDNLTDEQKEELYRRTHEWYHNLSDEDKEQYALIRKGWYDSLSDDEKEKHRQASDVYSRMTDKEKADFIEKVNWYSQLTDEEKVSFNESRRLAWERKSPEERMVVSKQHKDIWEALPQSEKDRRTLISKQWWEQLPDEERSNISRMASERWNNLSEDERKAISEKRREMWDKLSDEEKERRSTKAHQWYESLSDEEKTEYAARQKAFWESLPQERKDEIASKIWNSLNNRSSEEKRKSIIKRMTTWKNMPESDKVSHTRNSLSSGKTNHLTEKFENAFMSSYLSQDYYIKPEIILSNDGVVHSWDYGIYSKSDGQLIMVVDLDGAYYHADYSDYDGMHSKEEYDEKRALSVSGMIKHFIIQEKNFSRCFEELLKDVISEYDEYVQRTFDLFRKMPFPSPCYSNEELFRSFAKLLLMDSKDQYHRNVSLNTRLGDHLIQHFHPSIYRAKRQGKLSPYDAWYDDALLKKIIENRTVYQTYLNPNKILQGFNISKIAPKVSVFSAGRAKILIDRYLTEFDTIFDPFSGFSGRMLGALSLGKRYIGSDISPLHVNESNSILMFLRAIPILSDMGIGINAEVTCNNIFDINGSYQCLFTCPPYSDKEQWLDVKPSKRSCDDWIDECLKRFNCKRYLFVVDETKKYADYVVDEIFNKSHFGANSEYVVLIDR